VPADPILLLGEGDLADEVRGALDALDAEVVRLGIGGKHKCLRRGQFCSKSKDSQYHKYGFHCHNGRLK
jgi:hypothetical protein